MIRDQLVVAAFAIVGGVVFFAVWGPPHAFENLDAFWDFLALCIAALWLAGEVFLGMRWLSRRKPVVRTPLATFVFWAGLVSCLTLFTGFLLGWVALLLAPIGALAGIVTVVREVRSGSGNDLRNLIGTALCACAIVFLAA